MFPPYKLCIPQSISEIRELLGWMMLRSPTFIDKTGYFPGQDISKVFCELNEGLRLFRGELGEERYVKLMEMSDRMRAHFEADPEDKTDDTLKGREIIEQMEALLKQSGRKS
jgi:hypothetical protein